MNYRFFFALLLFINFSCTNDLQRKIEHEIDRTLASHDSTLAFTDVYDGFDSLMIFRPYSNISQIELKLHLDLSQVKSTNINMRDDILLFVLFKERKIIQTAKIDRAKYGSYVSIFKMYSKHHQFKLKKGKRLEESITFINE